jgi:hypothetical protein
MSESIKKFSSGRRHSKNEEETREWNFLNKVSRKIEVIFSAEKQILIEIVEFFIARDEFKVDERNS